MTIPHDTIDKLEHTWHAIGNLCADLDEPQWCLATDLPGWSVKDNVSHLIGTERMLQGLARTDHRSPAFEYLKNPIGESNEHEVDARRSTTGAAVLAEWNELVALRLATLRSADQAYYEVEAMTPTGMGTVADFLHIRVLDSWAHEQDIRRALDRPGGFDDPSAAHTIDRLIRTLPIVIGKRAATPEGAAVTVEITGPVSRRLTYEVSGGRAGLVDAATEPAVAVIHLDCEVFAILALGRRTAADLTDRIVIEGDAELGRRVVDQLNMMI
ncbi:MAG: maleylpyruvate isomerase family mycothiol-dependent enzyme [Actinomycetota bacterium]|nr:MAG: hypothetical protein FD127_3005 [Acidimicrobiaceae bacterium]